mmetsp:Transcript_8822/g.37003  ORF Transcript_8822/g.37003 Transcript_8822/m.37003 type:complete len:266 (-) Transcript_8822:282-1079(-)
MSHRYRSTANARSASAASSPAQPRYARNRSSARASNTFAAVDSNRSFSMHCLTVARSQTRRRTPAPRNAGDVSANASACAKKTSSAVRDSAKARRASSSPAAFFFFKRPFGASGGYARHRAASASAKASASSFANGDVAEVADHSLAVAEDADVSAASTEASSAASACAAPKNVSHALSANANPPRAFLGSFANRARFSIENARSAFSASRRAADANTTARATHARRAESAPDASVLDKTKIEAARRESTLLSQSSSSLLSKLRL